MYLGAGDGTFSNGTTASTNISSILSGDFNNDGRTDVLLSAQNTMGLFFDTIALSGVQASATVNGISITGGTPGFHQVFAQYEGNATARPSTSGTVPLPGPGATTVVPPPVFSPPGGVYTTGQAVYVAITDATPGTRIYYTTDGSTPTASSTPYVGPIPATPTSDETISAIAIVENYWPSATASATYTDPDAFTFNQNFGEGANIVPNGSASFTGWLQLTNGGIDEAGSAFYATPVNVQSFTTAFTFWLTNATADADGFTFTIQNAGPTALGSDGDLLGYSRIGQSVAVKFDLYQNEGDPSNNSTGLFVDGDAPIGPKSIDLNGTGINLHSGHMMGAYITYDGTTLNLTIADLTTLTSWSHAFVINIPATVGGDTAYVGFTGATGDETSTQQIRTWSYQAGQPLYYPKGFSSGSVLATNGSASLSGTSLELTNGGRDEAGSAFYPTPVNISSFTTDFTFLLTNANADGFTFTIQNVGPTALGSDGDLLGYSRIGQSVAVKFDLYQNEGDPSDNSTGIFVDRDAPIGPKSIDLNGTGINLHSGDKMDANLTYDGTTLTLTITDLVTQATWSHPFTINIPATVGGDTAYVGFTGATGGETSTQQILSWTFE